MKNNGYGGTKDTRGSMKIPFFFIAVATMLFSGCNIQNSFLYFPSSSCPEEEPLKAAHLKPWPLPSTTDYSGLVATIETKNYKGTVIVFHGNGGTAVDRAFYVETLAALGYRVILAEYPRYGGRKGELGEKAFVHDALETARLAFEQFGAPLFLWGESLGCGIATAVAKETSVKIEGIVLLTPWNTLAAVAQSKFPFLPVRLLLSDTYDNIGNLKSFTGRIAIVGAGRDEIIPVRHAKNLYLSISNPAKRMWLLQEAGHNNWLMYTSMAWWKEIMGFVSSKDKG